MRDLDENPYQDSAEPVQAGVKVTEKVLGNNKPKLENFETAKEKEHSLYDSAAKNFKTTTFNGRDASI